MKKVEVEHCLQSNQLDVFVNKAKAKTEPESAVKELSDHMKMVIAVFEKIYEEYTSWFAEMPKYDYGANIPTIRFALYGLHDNVEDIEVLFFPSKGIRASYNRLQTDMARMRCITLSQSQQWKKKKTYEVLLSKVKNMRHVL